jgi:hypothetical protein
LRLDVDEIVRIAWHASFQHLQQEKTCNLAHEQTPLSNDTIDSVPRHREVSRAKDLSAPPRSDSVTYLLRVLQVFSVNCYSTIASKSFTCYRRYAVYILKTFLSELKNKKLLQKQGKFIVI